MQKIFFTRKWNFRPHVARGIDSQDISPSFILFDWLFKLKLPCRKHCLIEIECRAALRTILSQNRPIVCINLGANISHPLPESNHITEASGLRVNWIVRKVGNPSSTIIDDSEHVLDRGPWDSSIDNRKNKSKVEITAPLESCRILQDIRRKIDPLIRDM